MQSPARVCGLALHPSGSYNLRPSCWTRWGGNCCNICDIAKLHRARGLWPFTSLGAPEHNFLQELWLWKTPAGAAVPKGLQTREALGQGDGGGTVWGAWESLTVTEFSPSHVSLLSVLVFLYSSQSNFH